MRLTENRFQPIPLISFCLAYATLGFCARETESGFSFYTFLFSSLIIHTIFLATIFLSSNTKILPHIVESLKPSTKILFAIPTYITIISISIFFFHIIPTPSNPILTHLHTLPPIKLLIAIFLIAIIGPTIEEIFFRLALLDATRSHILVAILFAIAHSNIRAIPIYFCISLLLSHLRILTHSLLPSIITHILYNFTVLSLAFF